MPTRFYCRFYSSLNSRFDRIEQWWKTFIANDIEMNLSSTFFHYWSHLCRYKWRSGHFITTIVWKPFSRKKREREIWHFRFDDDLFSRKKFKIVKPFADRVLTLAESPAQLKNLHNKKKRLQSGLYFSTAASGSKYDERERAAANVTMALLSLSIIGEGVRPFRNGGKMQRRPDDLQRP